MFTCIAQLFDCLSQVPVHAKNIQGTSCWNQVFMLGERHGSYNTIGHVTCSNCCMTRHRLGWTVLARYKVTDVYI